MKSPTTVALPLHDILKFLWRRRDRIPQGVYLPVSRRCASPFTFIIQMP